jgi:hypothetical protein
VIIGNCETFTSSHYWELCLVILGSRDLQYKRITSTIRTSDVSMVAPRAFSSHSTVHNRTARVSPALPFSYGTAAPFHTSQHIYSSQTQLSIATAFSRLYLVWYHGLVLHSSIWAIFLGISGACIGFGGVYKFWGRNYGICYITTARKDLGV